MVVSVTIDKSGLTRIRDRLGRIKDNIKKESGLLPVDIAKIVKKNIQIKIRAGAYTRHTRRGPNSRAGGTGLANSLMVFKRGENTATVSPAVREAEYAVFVEEGTNPHEVNHPGSRARWYFRDGTKASRPEIRSKINNAGKKIIGN